MNVQPDRYCEDFRSPEDGAPLCYEPAIIEAYFDGEWRPVCQKHARDHQVRRLREHRDGLR